MKTFSIKPVEIAVVRRCRQKFSKDAADTIGTLSKTCDYEVVCTMRATLQLATLEHTDCWLIGTVLLALTNRTEWEDRTTAPNSNSSVSD